jgi:hypothetical protein
MVEDFWELDESDDLVELDESEGVIELDESKGIPLTKYDFKVKW